MSMHFRYSLMFLARLGSMLIVLSPVSCGPQKGQGSSASRPRASSPAASNDGAAAQNPGAATAQTPANQSGADPGEQSSAETPKTSQPSDGQPTANDAAQDKTAADDKGARVMAYIAGWEDPPPAAEIAAAGYTHVFIAFGVFSIDKPGELVPSFTKVSQAYIAQLKQAGIKVLLSIGGAIADVPGTSVEFHDVLSKAASPAAFQSAFMSSLDRLIAQYGFDGIDIDIEHGLVGAGSFTKPTGDIQALANIILAVHAKHPQLLISLVPQVANVAATSGFDATWANYAALIMQTHSALAWVGIQLYNTGCANGIDLVCYANTGSSPDFSVAMATDLLADWPSKDSTGRATGFQPYRALLKPSQVVLGYPAANRKASADGGPITPNPVIKRALHCLRTGEKGELGCDTYVPPKTYPGIGGVFNWQINFDRDNNYRFAKELRACVVDQNCK